MADSNRGGWHWLLAGLLGLAVLALLAYARGEPGDGGRAPDEEHAHVIVVVG